MAPFAPNETVVYIALGLVALWRLPVWGCRVLDFLRDFRNFRDGD